MGERQRGNEKLVLALVSWAVREGNGQRDSLGYNFSPAWNRKKKAARVDAI